MVVLGGRPSKEMGAQFISQWSSDLLKGDHWTVGELAENVRLGEGEIGGLGAFLAIAAVHPSVVRDKYEKHQVIDQDL